MLTSDQITLKLVDVFAATDGGVYLVKFRVGLDKLQRQEENGDTAAMRLMMIARQFAGLVDALTTVEVV